MPILGIGLSTFIALCFAVHVLKNSREDRYWLFILFLFPFLGSVVYCIVVFVPSLRASHSGYHIESQLYKALDPNKALHEARNAYEIAPTVDTSLQLAKALVDSGLAEEGFPIIAPMMGIYSTRKYWLSLMIKQAQMKSLLCCSAITLVLKPPYIISIH